jgi:hypothetical protein
MGQLESFEGARHCTVYTCYKRKKEKRRGLYFCCCLLLCLFHIRSLFLLLSIAFFVSYNGDSIEFSGIE